MVAVIIPTYNRATTLQRCLDSIERQTYPEIEIVVVDDGSTDGTNELIAGLAATSRHQLRYVHQANSGCAAARNTGLRTSTSDRFLFLDSDDELEPNAIANLVAELDRSQADFVYSPAIEVYQDGSTQLNIPVAANHPERFDIEHFMDPNVRNGAVMFRRQLLDTVGFVNETTRYNEDSDFVQRCALHGTAAYSMAPTVRHFHHPGNKSGNRVKIYEAMLASCERVLENHPEFRSRVGHRAMERLDEIRRLLLDSLISSADFEAAARLAPQVKQLSLAHRLALPLRMPVIVKFDRALRNAVTAIHRKIRR